MTYPLCVFLTTHQQGSLPCDHPFYRLVEETLQNVQHCPPVLDYMAQNTLANKSYPTKQQIVQEIIQYLQNSCPTISVSDSPAMDSTFVDVRAYSGCGKDPKSRKFARKHVYIQKRLYDALMEARAESSNPYVGAGHFHLLTSFLKLCLLRGLITVVRLAFVSEDIDVKCSPHFSPSSSGSSFEHFLWEWNAWFEYGGCYKKNHCHDSFDEKRPKYGPGHLNAIVLAGGISKFRHIHVSSDIVREWTNADALLQLAGGHWTASLPVRDYPFDMHREYCLRIWDSPPMGDSKPQPIETTPRKLDNGYFKWILPYSLTGRHSILP